MHPRKKQIIDAAHHVFLEKGFIDTSIQDIIREANIAKGTFYNYFSSKNECLIAILEHIQEIGTQKRMELAIGHSNQDEEIFIQQILLRLQTNHQNHVFTILSAVFLSKDEELISFVRSQHKYELYWTSSRIIEIFGEQVRDYALDNAALLLSLIQNLPNIWKICSTEKIEFEKIVRFAFSRVKVNIFNQLQTKESFFSHEWLASLEPKDEVNLHELKIELIEQLMHYQKKLELESDGNIDYIQFLITELNEASPRIFLLESVTNTCTTVWKGTKHEEEMREIIMGLWKFIKRS